MQGLSSDFEQFFLVKNNSVCVFLRNKYGYQIVNAMEKINSVLTRKKCSKWLDTLCFFRFLDVPIPVAQVLRLYIQMFLSYGLYVYIILETVHHRTTFGILCNITQRTTPGENNHKMFHISSVIVLFLYGKVKDFFFFWIRIRFHLRRVKRKG